MKTIFKNPMLLSFSILSVWFPLSIARADVPEAIAANGEALVTTVHAEGVQVYECKPDAAGVLAWQFREPVATLMLNGKTVGRHYAGPRWELEDGSTIAGKVTARAPGATANDIPLLRLNASSENVNGLLAGVTTIQRLNTKGGVAEGVCDMPGALLGVPYASDYAFYKRSPMPYSRRTE